MRTQNFVHLNVHSHYSINDGCASIKELVDAAIKDNMPGVAITDNGNMFGVMEFCKEYGSKESRNRFWTHIDKKDPRKLVIHTRQFSNGISKDLIKEMASVIREHLRKLGLI